MVFELFDNKFLVENVLHQVSDEDEADQPPVRRIRRGLHCHAAQTLRAAGQL
jgi:hypothetical protein